MKDTDYLDSDDLRVRDRIDLHPIFYWRCIYNAENDNYDIIPFMRINNSDGSHADWMDVAVTEKHTVRYRDLWKKFRSAQDPKRTTWTRSELLHIAPFRDKYEYHKGMILLPPEHPEYEQLVSDFSVRLNAEDIAALNRIDGTETQMDAPAEKQPDMRSQSQKILDVLGIVADKLDGLDARITKLEQA